MVSSGCAAAVTGDPSVVNHDSASLRGSVVSDTGDDVEYWLEYGRTRSYGLETEHVVRQFLDPNEVSPVAASVGGLARSTTYHYRFCAQDSTQQGAPHCGEDQAFKTQSF